MKCVGECGWGVGGGEGVGSGGTGTPALPACGRSAAQRARGRKK